MKTPYLSNPDRKIVRQKAEKQFRKRSTSADKKSSEADERKLLHELQVHQIELEIVNEELRLANESAVNDAIKYAELYDFAPTGYMSLSREGKIEDLNIKAASMLGKQRQKLINSRFGIHISNETRKTYNLFLENAFTNNTIESCEVCLSNEKSLLSTDVFLTGHTIKENQQCFISLVDITKLKQQEKELKSRMTELTNAYEQLDRYISDNKELKQFAYISSHQLQQPLRTIRNFIKIIEEDYGGLFDVNVTKYLNIIKGSAERMDSYILGLSDYSRLGLTKKLGSVKIHDLIIDVINDLQSLIDTSFASIEVTEMPVLNVYEDEIRQVFMNLLSNALKYQRKNSHLEIKIKAEKLNGKWKFAISDNGIGIPEDQLEKVFNMFYRLQINEDEYAGSGIGLTICKKIVEIHHGEIWIDSVSGQGTTVYFTIPNLII